MTGLGDEVVTRCPTCGYGLTARRYAVPKDCPLCNNPFDAPAPRTESAATPDAQDAQAAAQDGQAAATDSPDAAPTTPTAEPPDPDATAVDAKPSADGSGVAGATTLHIEPAAVTSPLGEVTQRIPEDESKGAQVAPPPPPEESATTATPAETPPAQATHAGEQEKRQEEPPPPAPPRSPFETRMFTPPPEPRRVEPTPTPFAPPQLAPPAPHAPQTPHTPSAFAREVAPRVMNRYTDAYRVARTTVIIGNVLKVLGVLAGLVIGVSVFAVFAGALRTSAQSGMAGAVMGLFFGGGTFAFFFVLGVVISAQGQLIKATLDSAVGVSPFLTEEQRAEVMSVRY